MKLIIARIVLSGKTGVAVALGSACKASFNYLMASSRFFSAVARFVFSVVAIIIYFLM
jgi:uncharacterized membrane protein YciS (DUF1049 family)